MARPAPPLLLPRGLIFLASLWLIASWMITLGWRTPVQPSSASYTPGVRLMLLCVAIGLFLGWPLLRLSQSRPWHPLGQVWLDLLVLLGLVQVVIWPLRLVTSWTPLRTAALDATMAGWLLLIGAVVASAIATDRAGPRILGMLACIAICLLGPTLAWLGLMTGVHAMELVGLSPLLAIRTLSEGLGTHPTPMQWTWIALLGIAAAAVWIALLIAMRWHVSDPVGQGPQDAMIEPVGDSF